MKRYIYAFDTADAARAAIATLHAQGIKDEAISLIARRRIERRKIPSRYLDVSQDFVPAMLRGAGIGAVIGFFLGLVFIVIPVPGVTMDWLGLLGVAAAGAALGAWSSSLVGSSVPDEVRRKFADEIAAGRTLLVVDSNDDNITLGETIAAGADRHLLWQSSISVPDGSGRMQPR